MKNSLIKNILTFAATATLGMSVVMPTTAVGAGNSMTPYADYVPAETFFNGATLSLEPVGDTNSWITRQLETMRYSFNINCINVYGLESFDVGSETKNKDFLFAELKRLDMKIVVRIESYQAETFAFEADDLNYVMSYYDSLIRYVCQPDKKGQLAYFALNMPVDDTKVQNNMGGVNSEISMKNQPVYAAEFVKRMREVTTAQGFADAQLYLSIFYGWDNSFRLPSYAQAGSDGYFINNYSYPISNDYIMGSEAEDDQLINAGRLSVSMDSYHKQYAGKPLVVECGFHTLEYNNGKVPGQTAGLVRDKAAKEKATKAMTRFYKENYPDVRGILYFGYNLYKEEGSPPAVMDWSLVYPLKGAAEAESGSCTGGAKLLEDDTASGQTAVELAQPGSALEFEGCAAMNQLKLHYRCDEQVRLRVKSNGREKAIWVLPPAKEYTDFCLSLATVEGYSLTLELMEGRVLIDSLAVYAQMEAENALLSQGITVVPDENATDDHMAALSSKGDSLTFLSTRGGEKLKLRYKAEADSSVTVFVDEIAAAKLALPKMEKFKVASLELAIPEGARLTIKADENTPLFIDYAVLSGAPSKNAPAALNDATASSSTAATTTPSGTRKAATIGILAALGTFLAGVAAVTAVILHKRK